MARQLSKLEICVTQYSIIEGISSCLISMDLLHLAQASKTTWAAITGNSRQWKNLTAKGLCDGFGVKCRADTIRSSFYDYQATSQRPIGWSVWAERFLQTCGATREGVDSKPCEECGFMVCDECRVHCVYSTNAGPSSRRTRYYRVNFLGHMLGQANGEQYLVRHKNTSNHLKLRHDEANNITAHSAGPRRGQHVGWLVPNLLINLDATLNASLGEVETDLGHFHRIVSMRKRYMCRKCSYGGDGLEDVDGRVQSGQCSCTLKKHFVDRWHCLRCANKEARRDTIYYEHNVLGKGAKINSCACGASLTGAHDILKSCSWCGGKV